MAAPVVTSPRNPNVSGALNQKGRGATTVRRQVGIYTGNAASSRPLPVGSPLSAHLVPAQQQQQPSSLPRLLHLQTHTFTSKPGKCIYLYSIRNVNCRALVYMECETPQVTLVSHWSALINYLTSLACSHLPNHSVSLLHLDEELSECHHEGCVTC